jgi:hypothetical protein
MFLNEDVLGYVLKIPLVNSAVYNLYKLIPFSTKANDSENALALIESEKNSFMTGT